MMKFLLSAGVVAMLMLNTHSAEVNDDITLDEGAQFLEEYARKDNVITLESGVMYTIRKSGDASGETADLEARIDMHYTGHLVNRKVFDGTDRRKYPRRVKVKSLMPGLRQTISKMREGDIWEIVIPAEHGYGEFAKGDIPASSVLVFKLELLTIVGIPSTIEYVMDLIFRKYPIPIMLVFIVFAKTMSWLIGDAVKGPKYTPASISRDTNPKCFINVSVGKEIKGTVEFELFPNIAPKACENFIGLCNSSVKVDNKRLTYKDSKFHRIIPGFMIQGGDFTKGNGTGGRSIFEEGKFNDEFGQGFVTHEPYVLSMANSGANTNGSQFFITTKDSSFLDGKHVVFGHVTAGKDVVDNMENVGSASGTPSMDVTITKCGEIKSKST